MRQGVDFIIIGFQGCGTTTLFHHIKNHPKVFIPYHKECFWEDNMDNISFMTKYFPKNYRNKIIGHASPSFTYSPDMAEVVYKYFPKTKLITITRPRYEQIKSSWRGRVRRGIETRAFEECLNDNFYIERSDFKKILKPYRKYFKTNLLELKLSDLENQPQMVIDRIYAFLSIENFQSHTLGRKYNAGLIKPNKYIKTLKKIPIKKLIPQKFRDKIWWYFEIHGRKYKI